jgi:hypothetical protein
MIRATACMFLLLAACGPAKEPRTVSLRMIGAPPNASVTIDDQFVGTLDVVAARGVALPPGQHRVSVEAAGFFPFDQIVEAQEGDAPLRVEVKLVPVPD